MNQHIAIKLTVGGGPEPQNEIYQIYKASQENGTSWIATRMPGKHFRLSPHSQILAFTPLPNARVIMLSAKIVGRYEELPDDPVAQDLYGDYKAVFSAYWKIRNAELSKLEASQLPGRTQNDKPLHHAFSGQSSFVYWIPDAKPPTRKKVEATSEPHQRPQTTDISQSSIQLQQLPTVPLYGVDFSGAREVNGRNQKLWIANWHPDNEYVSLRCGTDDDGLDRRGIAEIILQEGGLWVMDFPFGPPQEVALSAGWNTWQDYLAWCGSHGDPVVLRDMLREILKRDNVNWSTRRKIDERTKATWFPFFNMLFRQTITGARDVLTQLEAANREHVSVLPFHEFYKPALQRSTVVEGFPGWTLSRMGLSADGYKNSSESARIKRIGIVSAIRQSGIPICNDDFECAIGDIEGDAVDSLTLLHAARLTLNRRSSEWTQGDWSNIEGWYFD